MPKISVVMPVYNCGLYIKEAIDSILNQSFADFEFLIIDDCSTDDTVGIIKTYEDSRIKLIQKSVNRGISDSLNLGIRIAKGYYIARMDGDDISYLDRFMKQIAFLDANRDVILCGSSVSIIGSKTSINYPEDHKAMKVEFLRQNCVMHPTVMFRKDSIVKFNFFYNPLKEPAEDYDLWLRLLQKGKLHNIPENLLAYRFHSNQVTKLDSNRQKDLTINLRLELLNNLNCKIEKNEFEILRRIIQNDKFLVYKNIQQFLFLKSKLIRGNLNCCFDKELFEIYLNELQKKIFDNYFLKRYKYSPTIYLNYLKFYKIYDLSYKLHFKLLLKALLFWRGKHQ